MAAASIANYERGPFVLYKLPRTSSWKFGLLHTGIREIFPVRLEE